MVEGGGYRGGAALGLVPEEVAVVDAEVPPVLPQEPVPAVVVPHAHEVNEGHLYANRHLKRLCHLLVLQLVTVRHQRKIISNEINVGSHENLMNSMRIVLVRLNFKLL